MLARLTVTLALVGFGVSTSAASLVLPFAYDQKGKPMLEYYPATAAKLSAHGRDWVRLIVRETLRDGPINLGLIVDCQARQLAPSPVHAASKDGLPTITLEGFKLSDLTAPPNGMYERLVISLCDGELLGVNVAAEQSGWIHFLEATDRALYYANGSLRKNGKYWAASVRLAELEGGQLADGRRFDGRDAVWLVDCERKLGAVAYERAYEWVGDQDQTVTQMGDEKAFANKSAAEAEPLTFGQVDKLKFGQPPAGSLSAHFSAMLCTTITQPP